MVGEDALREAADLLERRFGVDTLWLFGSEARGTTHAGSDLDLGALFRRRPAPLERLDAAAELAELLGREVDLVDLDRASPVLGLQVLRSGRLLVDRVHEYQALDPEIVEAIVERHLGDLRALGSRIVEAFGLPGPPPGV